MRSNPSKERSRSKLVEARLINVSGWSVGLQLRRYRLLMLGIILLCGTPAIRGECSGRNLNPVPAAETGQTVLVWVTDAPIPANMDNGKVCIGAGVFLSLLLFFAMGYTWQALDEEEFPDSELPRWFVSAFRGRNRNFGPPRI